MNYIVHGVANSQTQLSNFHFTYFYIDILIRLIPEMINTKVSLLFGYKSLYLGFLVIIMILISNGLKFKVQLFQCTLCLQIKF